MPQKDDPELPDMSARGFVRDVGKDFARTGKAILVWTGWGAAIGSIAGAGTGLYYFGTEELAFCALGGLVVGAIAGFGVRLWAATV